MKYIIINEFSEVFKMGVITDDEKNACDSGILDVIDTETMKQYSGGRWLDLEVFGGNHDVQGEG